MLIPYVQIEVKKKSRTHTRFYSGTLYNKFFIRIKGDYYIPLYMLHIIKNIQSKEHRDYTQFVFKWFKKYLKESMYEHVTNIVYSGEQVVPVNLKLFNEALLLNKMKDYAHHLYLLEYDVLPERKPLGNYYRLITTITHPSSKRLLPLVLRGKDAVSLPPLFSKKDDFLFYVFEDRFQRLMETPLDANRVGSSLTTLSATRMMDLIEFSVGKGDDESLVWVKPVKNKFKIPVLEFNEVDWDKLRKNHSWAGVFKLSSTPVNIIKDVYLIHKKSVYILTLWFKRKITNTPPEIHHLFAEYSDKLYEFGDLFIVRIPTEKIDEIDLGSGILTKTIKYGENKQFIVFLMNYH